ncbi:sugar/nucleoside kinase (ribokinase family) [Rhizobium sp. SG_E_25_P2]|uniref:tagatose kinase n=1 Tax=Rhizobium sp. SG_E_25_P2 TaxID=2879942 RepID=UPI002473B450|nr:sugar kinase [Rhizobium sp. SG_E_25_P2]MDH6265916.1 sugar/nucleoside kinase (ribokinase family) [Rhizobium sp. SG_E_25_P2]
MSTVSGIADEALGPTITIGEILVEIMATTIGEGFRAPQTLIGPFPSGAPAIFIDQVAKLGGACGIIAAVGDDDFGWLNIQRLEADGADVSAIAVLPDQTTGSAFVRYREDGSRDFVFNIARSAAGHVAMTEAAKSLISRAGHLHVMGSAFAIPGIGPIVLEALRVVKGRGGSVSLDPNVRKELLSGGQGSEALDAVLAEADLLLPSGEELFMAAGVADENKAIETLLARGATEIVVKRGEEGASVFSVQERIDRAAFVVEELDPTGAGDCFGATYLTCRRKGLTAEQSLRYANAAGALTVTRRGPMEGTCSFAELDAFIASQESRNNS